MMRWPMVVAVVCCMLVSCWAEDREPALATRVEAWLRAKHENEVPYSVAPGISGVVMSGNGTTSFVSLGVQSAELKAAVTPDTLFEIGSLSKTFVALALSRLVDRGIISFDDSVQQWLGPQFKLGTDPYVSETLTIRDLMAHRTGLAEGQADFLQSLMPSAKLADGRLGGLKPFRSLRALFDYNNTGWALAGEVLRAAAGAGSWCEALHTLVLSPLSLDRTFCHRNEIPDGVAAAHLASVHKMDPCAAKESSGIATYEFVRTGDADDFAWGAADAAGSVISSARDMAKVMSLLLRPSGAAGFLSDSTVAELLSPQMLLPASFLESSGVASSTDLQIGQAYAAGLGFDIVGRVMADADGRQLRYAEKNGDTEMHKARLGLFLERDQGILLLSNLGGAVGGQLSALKFGCLKLIAGGDEAAADGVAYDVLDNTDFWCAPISHRHTRDSRMPVHGRTCMRLTNINNDIYMYCQEQTIRSDDHVQHLSQVGVLRALRARG